ncbi:MAG: ATP-binding cassette domain-containing protein [Aquificales bacterium]|nr:ATP-binding cassette domain-containing protein [Aquificales bacterium]
METDIAIRLLNLSKTFGRRKEQVQAVRGINLEVTAGQVYGFLGPNGAGKSTTIRMIMDLIRPSRGEVHLYGQPLKQNRAILHQRVGGLVEGAAFYPFLTGRRNLELIARTGGFYDAERIGILLEQVNMADRADREVKGYSTGMKQRLGLAAALLNDPDLLILDEPANGLDPSGIQEMRHFIRDLVDVHGKTVFLSSHQLSEVEQVCDRVAIINKGEIIREGQVADLLTAQRYLHIEAEPLEKVTAVLEDQFSITHEKNGVTVAAAHEDTPRIVRQLVENDVSIFQVRSQRQSLETFFLEATDDSAGEAVDD